MQPQSSPPPAPMMVPEDVAFAVVAMGASVLLSAGFAAHEWLVSASRLDPLLRIAIFAGNLWCIRAILRKRSRARTAAVWLAVLFYVLLAVDADGLTPNDVWHMLAKTPIDLFVITRLYRRTTSEWLANRGSDPGGGAE